MAVGGISAAGTVVVQVVGTAVVWAVEPEAAVVVVVVVVPVVVVLVR